MEWKRFIIVQSLITAFFILGMWTSNRTDYSLGVLFGGLYGTLCNVQLCAKNCERKK